MRGTIRDGRENTAGIGNQTTSLVSVVFELHVVARQGFRLMLIGPGSRWLSIGRSRPRRRGLCRFAAAVTGDETCDFGAVCSEEARKHHKIPDEDARGYLTDSRRRLAAS